MAVHLLVQAKRVGPYLVMTTGDGTHLDTHDCPGPYRVYIYGALVQRSKASGRCLTPASLFQAGNGRSTFRFTWVDDFQESGTPCMSGLIDVHVAPGMTIPMDLSVNLALRAENCNNWHRTDLLPTSSALARDKTSTSTRSVS